MGLKSSAWYAFAWTDGYTPGPDAPNQNYFRHWGQGIFKEPNDNKTCVAADYTLSYPIDGLAPTVNGWGWNDIDCNLLLPYVCKSPLCEWRCCCLLLLRHVVAALAAHLSTSWRSNATFCLPELLPHQHCLTAVGGVYVYNSSTQGADYIFNADVKTFAEAEQFCRDNGGHLAAWSSLAEQVPGLPWLLQRIGTV